MRYLRSEAGDSIEDIAKQDKVSVETVKSSIRIVDQYRKGSSTTEMDLAIRSMVIKVVPKMQQTLSGLLDAEEMVEVKDSNTGKTKVVKREDKTTRLEALRIGKELIVGLQPKTPPVAVNVNQTNQVANLSAKETNEERLDRLRKQANGFISNEVAGVPEGLDESYGGGEDVEEDDEDDEEEDG